MKTKPKLCQRVAQNVPVYEMVGVATTTLFLQRQIGDVLVTLKWSQSAVVKQFGKGDVQIVYPSYTISAENPRRLSNQWPIKRHQRRSEKVSWLFMMSPPSELMVDLYLRRWRYWLKNQDKLPALTTLVPMPNLVAGRYHDQILQRWGVFDQQPAQRAP